ncbi:MAG TPA: autotransporter-associated beta strand repeat-containing protein, partial [Candidatus Paceibacterota bacterium]|nr:autotransporter-associated beta strand repeat-containing protein [Candidatus Paceibacterota bacterium]
MTDSIWSTTGNWDASPVPGTGETATFNGLGNGNTTIDLGAGVTVGNILFDSSAAAYTIGSGAVGSQALTFGTNGGITLNLSVANNQLFNANLILPAATNAAVAITNNSPALLTLAGRVVGNVMNGNGLVTIAGSGNTVVSGAVTNAGPGNMALLKTGSGQLTYLTNTVWSGSGAVGRIPATSAGFPLVAREGTLLFNGGSNYVNGELVIGGVVADGGAGQNARLIVDGSVLNVSSWFSIGRGNGIGGVSSDLVLTNAANVTAANVSAGFNGSGAANFPKGSVTLSSNSTLTITGNGALNFAESTGSDFTLTLKDSAQLIALGTGAKNLAQAGKGNININDNSSLLLGNAITYIGWRTGTGAVTMASSGIFRASGELRVGGSENSGIGRNAFGTLNVNSGTVYLGGLVVGRGNNNQNQCSGEVALNGGTVTSTNDVVLGYAGTNNYGRLTLNGATLNVGPAATKWVQVGVWDFTSGQLNINSGALNLMNNTAIKMNSQGTIGGNVINQNGGNVTFFSDAGTTAGGTGNLDLQYAGSASSANTYNLNGGTLTVPQITARTTTGTRTFNFNGGTLVAVGSGAGFMNLGSGATINVRNGGAIINANGNDITMANALSHSVIDGDSAIDGGLTKSGLGTLTLAGGATYTGPTVVNGGGLSVDVSSGTVATSGNLTVNGATFLVTSAGGYYGFPAANVSLQNAVVLNVDYATLAANPTAPFINASGSLTTSGSTVTININGFGLQSGPVTLIKYTGTPLNNIANFTLGSLPPGVAATLVNNQANNSIDLNITSTGQNLSWYGLLPDGLTLSPNWDITVTTNWVGVGTTSPALRYQEYTTTTTVGDPVRFDDSLYNDYINPPMTNINLTATVRPFAVVVDSASYPYAFSGSGGIAGQGSLVKSNTGSLTIGTSNSYTGGTFVYGGSVVITNENALGATAGKLTLSGGGLQVNANATN